MINKQWTLLAKKLRKNQTEVEKLLWYQIRNKQIGGVKFRRQQPIGPFIVDFIAFEKKLIIELDGGQHNVLKTRKQDQQRTEWLKKEGYIVLRFWNNEILENLESVLEEIRLALTLTLSPNGRGNR